eukprot:6191185-Pleurochrysis_carterae.AAC.1
MACGVVLGVSANLTRISKFDPGFQRVGPYSIVRCPSLLRERKPQRSQRTSSQTKFSKWQSRLYLAALPLDECLYVDCVLAHALGLRNTKFMHAARFISVRKGLSCLHKSTHLARLL